MYTRRAAIMIGLSSLTAFGALLAMNPMPAKDIQSDPKELKIFADETNQFGFDLYQQLRRQPGNVFVSPYSISSALAMTSAGARGQTAEQMTKVLHLNGDVNRYVGLHQGLMGAILNSPKGYDIRIANALWGQIKHPFKEDYVNLVQRSFRAEGRTLDFVNEAEKSRMTINRWVETQTNDRIKDLLPSGTVGPLTRLVLTNAIYFKGTWLTPFDKKLTKPVEFNLTSEEKIKTEMMWRSGELRYSENDTLQAVELPYQGNRLSMVVLLPKKKDGLGDLEAQLASEKFAAWMKEMKPVKVNLTFPRIKTTFSVKLPKTLQTMGMVDAFDENKADFSGMDGTRELSISDVIHKAFCEVNEEGTEAAASTAVTMKFASAVGGGEAPTIEFKADHPYLYLIRDTQTGSLLFLGRVADPRQ